MNIRWWHVGCLVAALCVAACGDDEDERRRRWRRGGERRRSADHLLAPAAAGRIASAVRGLNNGIKLALRRPAARPATSPSSTSRSTTRPRRPASGTRRRRRPTPARSPRTTTPIAYIGEFNSGATANSIPILNEAGILQVSPGQHRARPDQERPGAEPGEPDKYYPTGKRNYVRVVPNDTIQGAALATVHEGRGRHERLHPQRQGGLRQGRRANTSPRPRRRHQDRRQGLGTARRRTTARSPPRSRPPGADAVFAGGIIDNNGPQLYKDLARRHAGGEAVRPGRRGRRWTSPRRSRTEVQAQT